MVKIMEKRKTKIYQSSLLAVAVLLILSSLSVTTISASAPGAVGCQSTMSCNMGNGSMSCDASMMTTVTGVLQKHGNQFSIGSITLDPSSCPGCPSDGQAKEIRKALVHLKGETITVTGMLECSQPSTLIIFSINDVVYRTMCC
jgi:hypothetical protein